MSPVYFHTNKNGITSAWLDDEHYDFERVALVNVLNLEMTGLYRNFVQNLIYHHDQFSLALDVPQHITFLSDDFMNDETFFQVKERVMCIGDECDHDDCIELDQIVTDRLIGELLDHVIESIEHEQAVILNEFLWSVRESYCNKGDNERYFKYTTLGALMVRYGDGSHHTHDHKMCHRMYRYLQSKGFTFSQIQSVISDTMDKFDECIDGIERGFMIAQTLLRLTSEADSKPF